MIRLGYTQDHMFWRNKTATPHQSAEPALVDGNGQIQEILVRQPANNDENRGRADSRVGPAILAELAAGERAYVVPSSYRVSGAIVSSRPVVVAGEVVGGEIDAPAVYVSQYGHLAAPTKASRVIIQGESEADISASVEVLVGATATVRGSLNAPAIRIEQGAQVTDATLFVGPKR